MEDDLVKKLLIFLLLSTLLLTACDNKKDNATNAQDNGMSLEELNTIVNTVSSAPESDTLATIAETAMSLLNYGKEYNYTYIPNDSIQIIAVKEDGIQEEFDSYYKYDGEGIDIVWEFGFENLYIKTIDEEGNALFEFHFYPEGRTYLINPNYQNQITVNQEI